MCGGRGYKLITQSRCVSELMRSADDYDQLRATSDALTAQLYRPAQSRTLHSCFSLITPPPPVNIQPFETL